MNVIDRFPPDGPRELFVELLAEHDPELLRQLHATGDPTPEQRQRVGEVLPMSFEWIGEDYEPTPRTRRIEQLLEAFYVMWPLRRVRAGETAPDDDPSGRAAG
ncbi:hypothetical protein USB125703_00364 [Pseudoclavibacter triregionum]|nr:hypothetical protein USB125703_00364 [Pseudoclavibacter triregionum]